MKQNEQNPIEKTEPGILENHELARPGSSQVSLNRMGPPVRPNGGIQTAKQRSFDVSYTIRTSSKGKDRGHQSISLGE